MQIQQALGSEGVCMADASVDVLISGAGASGAALAWSLADTRMHILCLEQGDWMNPEQYPGTSNDWEAAQFGGFGLSFFFGCCLSCRFGNWFSFDLSYRCGFSSLFLYIEYHQIKLNQK